MKFPHRSAPSNQDRPRQPGFTILEFLIAFAILGLMGVIMFSTFRLSLNSYHKSQEQIDQKARQRTLEDLIRRQIGSLFPLRPVAGFRFDQQLAQSSSATALRQAQLSSLSRSLTSPPPLFYGTADSVTFVTLAPLNLLENAGLTVVRYGLAEDELGRGYLGAMEMRFIGQQSFDTMAAIPPGKPLTMVDNVETVGFEYYGPDSEGLSWDWYDQWDSAEVGSVPNAIRVRFNDETLCVPINAVGADGSFLQSTPSTQGSR